MERLDLMCLPEMSSVAMFDEVQIPLNYTESHRTIRRLWWQQYHAVVAPLVGLLLFICLMAVHPAMSCRSLSLQEATGSH